MLVIRNIREDKFFAVLSVIGIALGTGLFTGVKVASDRAISSFESEIHGISPVATYEIYDSAGTDFDERVYPTIRRISPDSLPVIRTFGFLPAWKDAIDIHGIYSLKAARFLRRGMTGAGTGRGALFSALDWESFYRTENGVFVPKELCDRYLLKKGDTMEAFVYDRAVTLTISDMLPAGTLPGTTVLMDIGNFQDAFRKTGLLTRIDLAVDEGTAGEIRAILPPHLAIAKKEELIENRKGLVTSFRYNLQFVSLIAILVGVFLLYNTVFMTVVKRRTEIGILRALGMERKTVIFLFTAQGLLLGLVGSLIGIAFGQLAAYFSVIAVEKTVSTLYSTIAISDYLLSGRDVLMSLALGTCISLIASLVPAYEASTIRPHETSREGSFEGRYRPYERALACAGIASIVIGISLAYLDYRYAPFSFPLLAYIGILFMIGGFTLVSPFTLVLMLKLLKRPAERFFRSSATLSAGDLRGNAYRFSVALMSVATSSALIFSLLIVIFSLRGSLQSWIDRNITADIYIKPASCKANYCFAPMSEDIVRAVESIPEVEAVDRFRGLHLDLFGKKVVAGFFDTGVKRTFLQRRHRDREYETVLREMENGEPVVGISEFLAIRHGLKKNETIEIQSPAGPVPFRIIDISSSYSTTSGYLAFHRRWLKTLWGLDDTTQMSAYVKAGADVGDVIAGLKARLLPSYALEIMNNRELRGKILDIFNKSFAITYAIELISIAVSLTGVISTLLSLVIERKREIGILRYLGTDWGQIRRTFVLSAGCIGITGIMLGTVLGLLMSLILIHVVNTISFGWEIQFRIPFLFLAVLSGLVFLTTVLAGSLPATIAKKIDPKRFISFE